MMARQTTMTSITAYSRDQPALRKKMRARFERALQEKLRRAGFFQRLRIRASEGGGL